MTEDNYQIKKIEMEKLQEALSLVWKVFLKFEAPDYAPEGVEEFKRFIEYDAIKEKLEKSELLMLGCFSDEALLGVIAFRNPCHISMLFVDEKHHKKGIARRLFNEMLEHYNGKCDTVTVNSSPYAVEIYKKFGFVETDAEQTVNGIRFIPMVKKL